MILRVWWVFRCWLLQMRIMQIKQARRLKLESASIRRYASVLIEASASRLDAIDKSHRDALYSFDCELHPQLTGQSLCSQADAAFNMAMQNQSNQMGNWQNSMAGQSAYSNYGAQNSANAGNIYWRGGANAIHSTVHLIPGGDVYRVPYKDSLGNLKSYLTDVAPPRKIRSIDDR